MLVEEAHRAGYGVNTTETRILLRASYNATEAQQIMVGESGWIHPMNQDLICT